MQQNEAAEALDRVQAIDAKVRPHGRWYAFYGIGYGLMSLAATLTMGLTGNLAGVVVGSTILAMSLCALSIYQVSQPVKPLGYAKLHSWGVGLWGVLYATTLWVGQTLFVQDPLWWVPMSVLTALPTSVAGFVALRRGRAER